MVRCNRFGLAIGNFMVVGPLARSNPHGQVAGIDAIIPGSENWSPVKTCLQHSNACGRGMG